MSVNVFGYGHLESVDVATNTTLALTTHSGKAVNVTATCTLTLPAVATMHRYTVVVGKPGITVTISPNAADLIAGAGAGSSGAGVDNKDVIFTNQPAGSFIVLEYGDTNGWAIVQARGSFTFEA